MENTLHNNGRRIHFYFEKMELKAVPVVLLHGFCEDASLWEPVLPYLEVQPVLRPDLPGFGRSEPLLSPGIPGYADAVCAVLNELNINRCLLYGHSMGGYTALAFAQKYPERLAGLSLVHSHPFADTPEQVKNRQRGIELLQAGKKDAYLTQLFPGLFSPAFVEKHPDVINRLVRKAQKGSVEGIIAALQSMIDREDRQDTLRQASFPVQFILGELDAIIPPARALQSAVLPNTVDIRLLPNIGHMSMFEAPEQPGQAIREFYEFCLTY